MADNLSPFHQASSSHALRRMQQRGISAAHVAAALQWGKVYRQREGRLAYFLGDRQVVHAFNVAGVDLTAYENTAVVVARDQTLVTVVRTATTRKLREALKDATRRRREGLRTRFDALRRCALQVEV